MAFKETIKQYIKEENIKALILGTGGASKAVAKALNDLKIKYNFASTSGSGPRIFSYHEMNKSVIRDHMLIINTTPLGMAPESQTYPDIPYQYLTADHLLYDLVYNPEETIFLAKGRKYGTRIINGLNMLKLQADKAWEIWNNM